LSGADSKAVSMPAEAEDSAEVAKEAPTASLDDAPAKREEEEQGTAAAAAAKPAEESPQELEALKSPNSSREEGDKLNAAREALQRKRSGEEAALKWWKDRAEPRWYEWKEEEGAEKPISSSFWLPSESEQPSKDGSWLRVFVGIWNLHGKKVPEDAAKVWVPRKKIKHHIYVLGTCECEQSIQKSFIFSSKAHWEKQMTEHLGEEYFMASAHTMNAIHMMVFVHEKLRKYVCEVASGSVPTGVLNVLGNKGSVEVGFRLGNTKLLFVNVHLPAHQEKQKERTESFERILTHSKLCPVEAESVVEGFDRIFFIGDLNWRLNASRAEVDTWLKEAHTKVLTKDQLLPLLQEEPKEDDDPEFPRWAWFKEAEIDFPPTYKFDDNSDTYDTKKGRVPAWTDRILWMARQTTSSQEEHGNEKGKPPVAAMETMMKQRSYDSVSKLKNSDHRPVFAQFDMLVDLADFTPPVEKQAGSRVCVIQ